MKRWLARIGLCTSTLVALVACGNGPPPDSNSQSAGGGGGGGVSLTTGGTPATTVSETDADKFAPADITVKVGDVVQFKNTGNAAHNVTFDAGAKTDGNMSGGDTVLFKFTTAGKYSYQCTIHPGMTGTVSAG